MTKNFSLLVLVVAVFAGAGCSWLKSPTEPSGPSPIIVDPAPAPPTPPLPPVMTPCEALPEACEGREPFEGTTIFVPIPFTSEFLEWQIIATKPGMNGTYGRDDQPLFSARCLDKANLVKNLYVEGSVFFDDPNIYGNGTWRGILSLTKFVEFGKTTVCSNRWFDLQVGTRSNGGGDPLLACCTKIDEIHFKFWINRSSAPALTPTDLEYKQYMGWKRVG